MNPSLTITSGMPAPLTASEMSPQSVVLESIFVPLISVTEPPLPEPPDDAPGEFGLSSEQDAASSRTAHKVIKYRIVSFGFLRFPFPSSGEGGKRKPALTGCLFSHGEDFADRLPCLRVAFLSLESVI